MKQFSVLLLLLGSCSFSGPLRVDKEAKKFRFAEPARGWARRNPDEGAQRLYEHKRSGAVLSVSSICDRYEIAGLEKLARAALAPLGFYEDIEVNSLMLSDREAKEIYAAGRVDGVPVEVDIVVLRKNDCVFDFSLQGSPKIEPAVREDFKTMLKGFDF